LGVVDDCFCLFCGGFGGCVVFCFLVGGGGGGGGGGWGSMMCTSLGCKA